MSQIYLYCMADSIEFLILVIFLLKNMYHEIVALEPGNSLRKKPRLSISEVAFHSEKSKIHQTSLKPQLKRKFSQVNLKDVLLSGLNPDNSSKNLKINFNVDPEQQNSTNNIKKSRSNSQHLHEQINQNFIVKHLQNQTNNSRRKLFCKSTQKISADSFLPSIFKNKYNDSNENVIKCQKDHEPKKTDEEKRYISLELQGFIPLQPKQTNISFKKLRSESLIHLQNKLKLQRAKNTSKNQDKQLSNSDEKKQFDLPRSNTQKANPTFTKDISPQKKQKKFYINNISLQTPQNHHEGLQKKNYILKFLQKHQKQLLPKQENRKNTYFFNTLDKDRSNSKPNPKNFYSSQNLISKKIIFSNPDEILFRKVQIIGAKTSKDKLNGKYDAQANKKVKQAKIKKDCINGWDYQNDYEQLVQDNEEQFQKEL